jgi:hypothetical protein
MIGRFTEIHWQRNEAVKEICLTAESAQLSQHRLRVEFVIARGTRQSRVEGDLTLDSMQGWTFFASRDGRKRDLE